MIYPDTDLVPLSALQHFMYCPRQCALIHVEQIWVENRLTAEGQVVKPAGEQCTDRQIERDAAAREMILVYLGMITGRGAPTTVLPAYEGALRKAGADREPPDKERRP